MARVITKGYMKILWYQHKTQGANSITSLKNRLPSIAMLAISQAMNRIIQLVLDFCSVSFNLLPFCLQD